MNDLAPILVVGIIAFAIYRLFELFVRRGERMAIIDKLTEGLDMKALSNQLNLPILEKGSGSWAIKIGMLLLGIGFGVVVAVIVDMSTEGIRVTDNAIHAFYPACAAVFGGLGLVIAYFVERKGSKKD
ncbi:MULTISPECIES: DUF6249 domain-containing protein [unclassified Dysgonomonas]|uniref:DUF6249 domain-containing protein n=1 Tax=unclassified Dysgonomonas TaxID=2630389 RepID=UPI0013EBF876|nr:MULTISPECIES: DUF6249 domain-containing protein [unclassified Dysgonomonas]